MAVSLAVLFVACSSFFPKYLQYVQEDCTIKPMEQVSYSDFRQNLKQYCDAVCSDHEPLRVSRRHHGDIVVIPQEDYASLLETAYLLQSPANAARLMQALEEPRSHQTTFESLDDLRKAFDL
jgi:antitoxin YefM